MPSHPSSSSSSSPSPTDSAIVARGPVSAGQWTLEPVTCRAIKDDEVLVRIIASGICLADVHFGDVAVEGDENPVIWYPRVLGHEGSGYVEKVGSKVQTVSPGDPVILSYLSCGECYNCQDDHPAYCIHCWDCNFTGERGMYAKAKAGSDGGSSSETNPSFDIGGAFFGQSSFASRAIVKERSVVNLKSAHVTERELQILAPLGCGVQTGSGAFLNIAQVQPQDEVAVIGVGGVGQSAIMAAAMVGCKTIIAIDRHAGRLQLAKTLGATHTINTSAGPADFDLVAEVRKLTGGRGVKVSLDTTGVQALAAQSWHFVRTFGKVLQVGLAPPEDAWHVSMADHMNSGKQIIGCVQGDAISSKYILDMITWYREGKLPVDKLVSMYPVTEYQKALQDMREGTAIKPVLLWTYSGAKTSRM